MKIESMEIIISGRSNVGKSSIVRELTGKKVKIGKRPGVTRSFERINLGKKLELVDLPGFGFIAGMNEKKQDKIKDKIVQYLEKNTDNIILAIQVIDTSAFLEIVERWKKRDQIPVDVELFSFLQELELDPIVVANKIDKIKSGELSEILDEICVELGLDPPWRQWLDVIVPVSAKTGEGIDDLDKLIRKRFQKAGKEELLRYL
ncbi:GTP-binding protein [candidate division MSBL1 archaeon SCGC-AAA382A03]|uniref:Probable GTP-binding protein EngB n=1 Tax=candidate division MSBL1 archaeon SCGC-AAA382A03 TaxID=1698278 RepID=A0A133VGI4_9EURY|nr:GTP-binding protein [candidate division MSBL1 archaeon SCGC-AAA382A03]